MRISRHARHAAAKKSATARICACAGLGKTTLAHVLAGHCGFRVVEINASDERTASSLTHRISNAVQMQAVMGDRRPNCVVIDEIDGATGMHSSLCAFLHDCVPGNGAAAAAVQRWVISWSVHPLMLSHQTRITSALLLASQRKCYLGLTHICTPDVLACPNCI